MKAKIIIAQLALHLITGSIALGQSSNQITILGESDFYAMEETNITYKETSVQSIQLLGGPSIFIGARIMPTITSFNFKKIDNSTVESTAKMNYGLGAVMGIHFTSHIGVQGELIYSRYAQKFKTQEFENEIRLSYINVPVLLSFNTGSSSPVNLNFVIGPQWGFNVGSKLEMAGSENDSLQARLAVKKSDFGIAYGAGFDFGLGQLIRFGIGFRGVYGLVDISDNNTSMSTNEYFILDKTHIKTYSAYAGVTFGF
jgi:Outer membrane protein beta-barrel domain